jgi:hypothetical protein
MTLHKKGATTMYQPEEDRLPPNAGELCADCAAWLRGDDAALDGAERWFYGGMPPVDPRLQTFEQEGDEHDWVALPA